MKNKKITEDEIIEIEEIECDEEFMDLHTEIENYIAENIIVHNSTPSKKSIASGFYMPTLKKEEINVTAIIDVSGSIGNQELKEFLTEIVSIGKSFNNVKIRVLSCDTDVNNDYLVENGDIPKIMDLKMVGGGGTDLRKGFNYIEENIPNNKLVVVFTDGYTNFPDEQIYNTLWILSSNGVDEKDIPFGEVVKL